MKKKAYIGSSFEGFLKEKGTYEETTALAVKRVLAFPAEHAFSLDHRIELYPLGNR